MKQAIVHGEEKNRFFFAWFASWISQVLETFHDWHYFRNTLEQCNGHNASHLIRSWRPKKSFTIQQLCDTTHSTIMW